MKTELKVEIETIMAAYPGNGMTLDQLEERMKELGNKVLERRADCLIVGYVKETALELGRG